MYSTSELVPWRGVSPMGWSPTTSRLVERLERSIADEVSTPVGQLLALPEGHAEEVPEGETDPLAELRSDLEKLRAASKARAWRSLVGKEAKMDEAQARRFVGFE